jgi:hypothetical protein
MPAARLPNSTRVGTSDSRPYNRKDNTLCGSVIRIAPGVSKDDLRVYALNWQVVCGCVSLSVEIVDLAAQTRMRSVLRDWSYLHVCLWLIIMLFRG